MDEQRIREIYAATIGFSGHSDDVTFGMAVAREVLELAKAALAKLTRYDDVYRYGETVMLAVGEDNPRGNGEYVRFDDVREALEGMIDAQHKAG